MEAEEKNMEFEEVLQKRHSCRKFSMEPIGEEKIEKILKAAQMGPSARNLRPYRFVLVESEEKRQMVYDGLPFGRYPSPLIILVVGDERKSPNGLWQADCAISAENILLEATNLGIASLWCAVYPYQDRLRGVNEVAETEEGEYVYCAILLGHEDGYKGIEKKYEKEKVRRV